MKKLMNVWTASGVVLGLALCGVATAQDAGVKKAAAAGAKPAMERPALVDMTVTGKISKDEQAGAGGAARVRYVLTDAQGNKVMLSSGGRRGPAAGGDAKVPAPAAVDLAQYVGKDVTVVGKGFTSDRNGVKMTRMVEITKVEAAGAAPAPVAPAPATATPATPAPAAPAAPAAP